MYNKVNSISMEYGDTKITFFQINLQAEMFNQSLWHDHRYYEIHFCWKGSVDYTFSDQTVRLNPKELLIIPPNTFHNSITTVDKQNIHILSFAVTAAKNNKRFYKAITSALNKNALAPLRFPCGSQVEWDVYDQEDLYSSLLGICKLKSEATKFIYLLFNCIIKEYIAVNSKTEIPVLLDNLINRPNITLDEIAAATHYSKRHISRLIKQQYGVSFSVLRKNIRKVSL